MTPRGLLDCVIVTVALRVGAALLAPDQDFVTMAGVFPVVLEPVTRGG